MDDNQDSAQANGLRERLPAVRVVAAMLAVFLAAALAQSVLSSRAARTRRTELALTRIQSRVFLESLLQQRALEGREVPSTTARLADELDELDHEIAASVELLPKGEQLDDVRVAVASHRRAVEEGLELIRQRRFDEAVIHDRQKINLWFAELGRSIDDALGTQREAAARTDRLTEGGSLAALLLACVTVGVVLLRFERARMAAATVRERVLAESEARFRALVQNSSDVVIVVNAAGILTYVSPSAVKAFAPGGEDLTGESISPLIGDFIHPDDQADVEALLRATADRAPDDPLYLEFRARANDGSWRVLECTTTNSLADPYVCGIVATSRDITQRKVLEERLRHQAFHDSLTRLPNRALLLDRMDLALARRDRAKKTLAVLLLDLDGFKRVNDSLGHAAGDELLVEVASRLTECVRGTDSVARLGGDEFAVLLEELTLPGDAPTVAQRMLDSLALPFVVGGKEIFIHASIGIVLSSVGEHHPEELLRDADVAMYAAKGEGKNRAKVFEPSMRVAVLERMTLEGDLRAAIENEQVVVFYQPVVELATSRVTGVEALARWQHPERGLMSPAQFIPLAEETGLIVALGRCVLQEACRQLKRWQQRYPSTPPLTVSVNLSGRQLQDPALVDHIGRVIRLYELEPASLTLEITESVLMEQTDRIARALDGLRSLGVRLAIDDFGTGYSSLSYLQTFPIDVLKIDRSFIMRVADGPEESALTRAIVKLAHTLDLGIVAEGIEEAEQLDLLRDIGCPHGQGFLFSEPLSTPDMNDLLRQPDAIASFGPQQALAGAP